MPTRSLSDNIVPRKKKTEESSNGLADPEKNPAGRKRSRSARSTSTKKKSAAPRKAKTPASTAGDPTDDEIRIRAYFIAERRYRLDLPGDADSDWLEAKRQLLSELGPR